MALVLKDRVKETSVSTGTGAIALDGATGAYQTFSTIGNGNTTYYAIAGQTTNEWEVGIGTYTSSTDTLSRDTILASSNSGSIVTFSAGTKDVFITYPSEKGVWVDASGTSNYAATIGSTAVNLGATVTTLAGLTSVTVTQDPSVALDLATKQYVDGLVSSGITFHDPVKYEVPDTTGNLTATYNNGTAGVGATLTNAGAQVAFTPDGIVASVNDRVLVYNQTNATQNGVYTVTTVGSGSTNWVLTRATDADSYGLKDPNALGNGDAFFVTSGNTGAGETYVCNTPGVITFGTTNITFAQITSSQVYNAGTGLTLSPATTFNIANTAVTPASYGAASKTLTATVNAQGQLTALADTNIAISMSQVTSGTLGATQGGTGQSSYSIGDILYADTTTSLARLADVATGSVLISGGIGAAPSYGKVGLTTHVSGTLPVANGGTGVTSSTGSGNVVLSTSPTLVTPALGSPTSGNFSAGTFTWPTFNQNTTGTAANVTGIVAIANGGTGESTRQAAMDALAGATTSGQYLRGNGTDVVMANIVAGDVPTLNQNTTGTAGGLSGTPDISVGTVTVTAGTAGIPAITTAGDTNTGIFFPAADTIAFSEGGTESMRIDSAGRVGIGTTGPRQQLSVGANLDIYSGGVNSPTVPSVRGSAGNNIILSGFGAGAAFLNFDGGTGGVNFCNGAGGTVASMSSAGGLSAVTGSFSGQVTGKSSGTDATPSFYAVTSGSSYASMWNRRGSPFTTAVSQTGSSYAPSVSLIYNHNSAYDGVYSIGVLNESAASPGAFNIHHINSSGGLSFAWQFQGSTGNFSAPGTVSGTNITASGNVTGSSTSCSGNAATATSATSLNSSNFITQRGSGGSWNADFSNTPAGATTYNGDVGANTTNGPGGTWWMQQNFRHTNSSNLWGTQVAWGWEDNANRLATRNITAGTYGAWVEYLNSSNYLNYAGFPSGTAMLFAQTSAPTGWTKSTAHDNKALRIVSGAASSGGSVAFTTAFQNQGVSGSISVGVGVGTLAVGAGTFAVGATTLAESQMPSHTHSVPTTTNFSGSSQVLRRDGTNGNINIGSTGGGGSHTHGLTGAPSLSGSPSVTSQSFSGNAINLAVQYVDAIIATKN